MANLSPIIGLEIHVELKTKSKMFCGCKNDPFHAQKPNTHTCPVCLGMPGALPVANKKAIEWTIRLGQALGCEVANFSKFDRKHYFYPDLSKGYQISQYDQPLCVHGMVKTEFGDIRINRVHLEEDTGKLLHTTINGKKVSLIDFNRSGVPLVEIVTEPDITSPEQAKAYAKKIQQVVRTINVSDANMEQGSMRLEANISLTTNPKVLPNYKVEVKNINSFRFLEQACVFEMARQKKILEEGGTPTQETRGWNETKQATISQRTKEEAADYRYFPDPDLPPMQFTDEEIQKLRDTLPELPDEQYERFISLGIKPEYARLASESDFSTAIFDQTLELAQKEEIDANTLASAIFNKKIVFDGKTAKEVVAQAKALFSFSEFSDKDLITIIDQVLKQNPTVVEQYKNGKTQVLGFLMGQVMREAKQKLDPKRVSGVLVEQIQHF